jgi:hypothetical protein
MTKANESFVVTLRRRHPATLSVLSAALLAASAFAQTAPTPPATRPSTAAAPANVNASSTSAAGDQVIELSPFQVRPEDDTGYQATNTTSGSRLATSLKETAASISPFTPEFLSDIARRTSAKC